VTRCTYWSLIRPKRQPASHLTQASAAWNYSCRAHFLQTDSILLHLCPLHNGKLFQVVWRKAIWSYQVCAVVLGEGACLTESEENYNWQRQSCGLRIPDCLAQDSDCPQELAWDAARRPLEANRNMEIHRRGSISVFSHRLQSAH